MREQAQAEARRVTTPRRPRSRPTASRPSPRCAPRSARSRSSWPARSSASRCRTRPGSGRLVDRFLDELEAQPGRSGTARRGLVMRGVEPGFARRRPRSGWPTTRRRAVGPARGQLGDELFAVAGLLDSEPALRRALTDPAARSAAQAGLAAGAARRAGQRGHRRAGQPVVSARWSDARGPGRRGRAAGRAGRRGRGRARPGGWTTWRTSCSGSAGWSARQPDLRVALANPFAPADAKQAAGRQPAGAAR